MDAGTHPTLSARITEEYTRLCAEFLSKIQLIIQADETEAEPLTQNQPPNNSKEEIEPVITVGAPGSEWLAQTESLPQIQRASQSAPQQERGTDKMSTEEPQPQGEPGCQ